MHHRRLPVTDCDPATPVASGTTVSSSSRMVRCFPRWNCPTEMRSRCCRSPSSLAVVMSHSRCLHHCRHRRRQHVVVHPRCHVVVRRASWRACEETMDACTTCHIRELDRRTACRSCVRGCASSGRSCWQSGDHSRRIRIETVSHLKYMKQEHEGL